MLLLEFENQIAKIELDIQDIQNKISELENEQTTGNTKYGFSSNSASITATASPTAITASKKRS